MKQTLIISALSILLMTACASHPKDNTNFSFNLAPNNEILFSEIFNKAEYHLLLPQDSVQLGEIEYFRVSHNYLGFISTKGTSCSPKQVVYILNKEKLDLKLELSNQGYGHDQYVSLWDMQLGDDEIQLLDKCGKKILIYDYEGNLKRRIEIPFNAESFFDAGDDEYWLYANNYVKDTDYQLTRYNPTDSVVDKEFFPRDKHIASYLLLSGERFVSTDRNLYFYAPPAQTIYALSNDTIEKAYTFDFGKHNVPEGYYKQHFNDVLDFSEKTNEDGYVYLVTNYGLNKDNLVLSFLLKNESFLAFGNTKTMATKCGNILVDDINDLKGFKFDYSNSLFAVYGDELNMIISPEQIIGSCEDSDYQKLVSSDKLTTDSNPIIMTCELKE